MCEALQRKRERRDSKNKVIKTCRKDFFLKKSPERNWKKGRFFGGKKTEMRDFHSFTESCRQRKNTKKSERKRSKRLVRKKTHPKKEKTQGWKNIRTTMKKAEKKE